MAGLNHRFARGQPSNELDQTGVLLHQLDAMDDGHNEPEWLPCPAHQWCHDFGDRFSASIVNSRLPFIFSPRNAGFVLNPAKVSINCAYPKDGATMHQTCNPPGRSSSCMPGCAGWGGSFPADRLVDMLQQARGHSRTCCSRRVARLGHAAAGAWPD